jgi:hypothetical protein
MPRSEWNYILGPSFLCNNERVDGAKMPSGWHDLDFDDSPWPFAVTQTAKSKMLPTLNPWRLTERPIPMLPEVPSKFRGAVKCSGSIQLNQWNSFFQQESPIVIPSQQTIVVEVETSVLTTGFLVFRSQGGKATRVRLMCAESYEKDLGVETSPFPMARYKGDRKDHINGRLYGPEDFYTLAGGDAETTYEPFWFRTFRYVRMEITTADHDMTLLEFSFRETNYPLEISTQVQATPELEKMWQISLNTLRNCMHETYEDCPFYEQNQFAMDARAQILFTYQLSRDDRLARKCMEEFFASRRPDGLIETHFPCPARAINIPQFSLYWILMVYDHMQYFGDKTLVRRYIGTVDGILDHFDSCVNSLGLVGKFDGEAWPFIDWVKEWHGTGGILTMGIPAAYHTTGSATYNSLVYAMVLQYAAKLCDFLHRPDTAAEYRARAASLNNAVNRHCFAHGLYNDGPGVRETCQHTQIFAILSGAINGDAAKLLMKRCTTEPSLPRCSYSMGFYVFRAAEKVGLYAELYKSLTEPWREMVASNLTTWAEDNVSFRSDCHGWSATPIYETVALIYGLTPAEAGYSRIRIEPRRELLEMGKGTFCTARGTVGIEWSKEGEVVITVERDVTAEVAVGEAVSVHEISAGIPLRLP